MYVYMYIYRCMYYYVYMIYIYTYILISICIYTSFDWTTHHTGYLDRILSLKQCFVVCKKAMEPPSMLMARKANVYALAQSCFQICTNTSNSGRADQSRIDAIHSNLSNLL